ncbi:plasmid pRiA4b ORF-3 family protein [Microbacterium sp.]|uniref:plasmid pRiA4b ORF-3 family protein n=1 Tax=Microbacterium sp. TaxID=51671 RepID=UPI000929D28B|nr:plasmid pRiA4b ORF-3 family protein [Microbacterium sp.]MBN9194013.1 plasmid pRiA4b ORF-3 family protein [Microbacterium sp.]OJU57136.1 MAG: hypothetical protein BGO04_03940 [Microbacterium sp. 70-38]
MSSRRAQIIRLRASIVGIEPEIWRTIDVDDSMSLVDLHRVLQVAFGWHDAHLHSFSDHDPSASANGIPRIGRRPRLWVDADSLGEFEGADGEDAADEAGASAREAMSFDGPLWYVYDFGDGWVHRLDVIDRDGVRAGEAPASIVAGERRSPFEDSGGEDGYRELTGILADARHPEHRSARGWVRSAAGPWGVTDPEDADLAGARAELAEVFADASWPEGSLIEEFAAGLHAPLRSNLRRHLRRTGVLDDAPLPDGVVADSVAPYRWLVERIGTEGVTLTKAGWMPPVVVREGMEQLGWRDDWIGEANREDLTYPMRHLRASAERLRLVRKVTGRLVLTTRTGRALGRPGALADEIAHGLLRQRMTEGQRVAGTIFVLGLADGTITSRRDAERTVVETLTALGYVDREGRDIDVRSFSGLVDPVLDVLRTLGLWRVNGRSRDVPPSAGVRAIARRALR